MKRPSYHREPRHDYMIADELFAAMPDHLSRTARCRRIARATGISWSTLYARYFTNIWRHRQVCSQVVQTVEPARIDYRAHLERIKAHITQRTGIEDFMSEAGQRELEGLTAKRNYHFTTGHEEINYVAIAE